MAQERKYKIGCSGSGWGIWDNEGKKVMWCRSHYDAVENLYHLMGWNWNPSKYRRNYQCNKKYYRYEYIGNYKSDSYPYGGDCIKNKQ